MSAGLPENQQARFPRNTTDTGDRPAGTLLDGFDRDWWVVLGAWILIIAGFWALNIWQSRQLTRQRAMTEARAHFLKDQAFRFWGASHGGVYVPRNERTPANTNLAHIPERDLTTPSGRRLTLMNPAYMVRQMNEEYGQLYGVVGHITSTRPLRPGNRPDPWERKALESFEEGVEEVMEFTHIDGQPYLRLIQPMVAKASCLKCHGHQGYQEGDIRGGVAVALPLTQLLAGERKTNRAHSGGLLVLLVLGLGGLLAGRRQARHRIRERDHAVQDLHLANQELAQDRNLFLQGPVVVFKWRNEPNWPVDYVSGNALAVLGYDRDEWLEQKVAFQDLVHPEDLARVRDEVQQAVQAGADALEHQPYRLRHRAGRSIYVLDHTTVIREPSGRITHFLGYLVDVTEMKEIEQQLVRHERLAAVGQLSAGVAHDFNNILTFLLGNTEMLMMTEDLDQPTQEGLAVIQEGCQRAAHLVRQILDFSQKTVHQTQVLDLAEQMRETVSFLEAAIPESIQIVCEAEEGTFPVEADPTQLHQVLANLAVNASKAMPEGGSLHFRVRRGACAHEGCCSLCGARLQGAWLQLEVEDTGCGMFPEVVGRIFEPFYTTRPVGEGSGLGLSQVAGIVAQHGGHVVVRSRPDRGTTFLVLLPEAGQTAAPAPEGGVGTLRGEGRTVLLVEDDPDVLRITEKMLQMMGFAVVTAANGGEALAIFEEGRRPIDLVLTDMVLPDFGGEKLQRILHKQDPGLCLVAMSGYPAGRDAAGRLPEGFLGWLEKPLTMEGLSQGLEKALLVPQEV